jgi:8-oxo-dGTP diphosphatase
METVVPLAGARRLAVEVSDALAEGASLDEIVALVRKHASASTVMCTHGDVIPMLLEHAARHGVDIGPAPQWPKGCTWVLQTDAAGEIKSAEYFPPPPD